MRRYLLLAFVHVCLLSVVLSFQNCTKVNMNYVPQENDAQAETGDFICSPFGESPKASANSGIKTELRYISSSSGLTDQQKSQFQARQYFESQDPALVSIAEPLYLSSINIPSRRFDSGFALSDGSQLRDNQGNLLFEFFALKMESLLQLGPNDPEGYYELATISDDGSVLQIQESGGNWVDVVSNDGAHSAQMGCMNRRVHLTRASRLPIRIYYNQGERFEIANTLIWIYRGGDSVAVPVGSPSDSEIHGYCGQASNENYWNPMTNQDGPWATALWKQGWKILSSENFVLPNGEINPCAVKP